MSATGSAVTRFYEQKLVATEDGFGKGSCISSDAVGENERARAIETLFSNVNVHIYIYNVFIYILVTYFHIKVLQIYKPSVFIYGKCNYYNLPSWAAHRYCAICSTCNSRHVLAYTFTER